MIQLMSRAGNFSCALAGGLNGAMPPRRSAERGAGGVAQETTPIDPQLAAHGVLLSPVPAAQATRVPWAAMSRDLVERVSIQEVCKRDVLRDETGGVDQNSLVIALATLLLARYQLVDLAVELLARELARLDHPLELALQHVEVPTVDDDLVHLRPARRIELAARQRDEGAAWLEPRLAAHHVARSGAADGDIGATHDLFDRILGHDCNPERLRPFPRKRRPRLGPTRGTTDFLEPVHA